MQKQILGACRPAIAGNRKNPRKDASTLYLFFHVVKDRAIACQNNDAYAA